MIIARKATPSSRETVVFAAMITELGGASVLLCHLFG
jgi:hypothetical protein